MNEPTTLFTGWIAPQYRSTEQMRMTNAFFEEVGSFDLVASEIASLPERVIFEELEQRHLGRLLLRVQQLTGSCVGSAAAQAYARAMLGDVIYRGDNEEVKLPFPFATYGVGREIAGMGRRGEGSFGAAQAKACQPEYFGYLPYDDPRLPQPTIRNGWAKWTKKVELDWSHPSGWPIQRRELQHDAKKYGIHRVTRIRSVDQWMHALAQGYMVTLASMYGTKPSVQGDMLVGPWNGEWAHQMFSTGYWRHPRQGTHLKIDNNWGPNAHGDCPTLSKLGCRGSFWCPERDAERICRDGEVFAHSSTGGFPGRNFEWTLVQYA